jgi:predicted adenine nucleotide alpha hydrolase (AANH) superfamily ATPase
MLLHVCCATCAAYPVELLGQDFDITMFFYNPNIYPREEYLKRLESVKKLSRISGISLMEGPYNTGSWSSRIRGTEDEPEGGKRCFLCFGLRLERTASAARKNNMDIFASTLSISPRKDTKMIFETASVISKVHDVDYYPADLKKKDGFKRTNEISRAYEIYRQDYCGCKYSIRK